jgi:HK97 family phage prohead protease
MMPWSIEENHESCPASEPWAVVKDDDGEVEGCHPSRAAAEAQLAALYAAESKSDHPRDDVFRMTSVGDARLRADESGDGNTLVGYAAVFDSWTEIDSWEGRFVESLDRRAFQKTLRERAGRIKVLFDHGMDPTIGNKPLGRASVIRADDYGLWTETPLAKTTYNEDLRELLSVGAIDGMSFRMSVVKDEWNDDPQPAAHNPRRLPERRIKEVKLYEFGPVTFPAYEATTAGVRARDAYLAWRQAHHVAVHSNTANSNATIEFVDPEPASAIPVGQDDMPAVVPPAVAAAMRRVALIGDITARVQRADDRWRSRRGR